MWRPSSASELAEDLLIEGQLSGKTVLQGLFLPKAVALAFIDMQFGVPPQRQQAVMHGLRLSKRHHLVEIAMQEQHRRRDSGDVAER